MKLYCGTNHIMRVLFNSILTYKAKEKWQSCCKAHDIRYAVAKLDRRTVDKILFQCWNPNGFYEKIIAVTSYLLIRAFGGRFWKRI